MKVLLCHNYYREPGGEDLSFEDEGRVLESNGVEVLRYTLHNKAITRRGYLGTVRRTFWNMDAYRDLSEMIARERPGVMHCTNTFPLLSPSCYAAAHENGVPVVQALRNYRLLCPNALFFRDGAPCEDCLGKALPWPGAVHGCYRKSRPASTVVAAMLWYHRSRGSWDDGVDLFLTPSEFARRKFVEGGFDPDRIVVKPNFVFADRGPGPGDGGYAVFVGRLAPEKGIETLIEAWRMLNNGVVLKVVGGGPLAESVRRAAESDGRIEWLGHRPHEEVLEIVGNASLLVVPSVVYETFGRSIVEAFSLGTPVVASRRGAMAELVEEGRTGQLFEPGDARDLARAVRDLLQDRERLRAMRREARSRFETRYTAEANHRMMLETYARAAELHATRSGNGPRPGVPA